MYKRQGRTRITIQFALDRNIDAAALDVQSAIGLAQRRLPTSMTTPPSFRKVNPADMPILYLRVSSPTLPLYQLNEYADTLIGQRLSMVEGVAQVVIYGQKKYAVRVQLDPDELASRGLGIDEVADAVAAANSMLPTGSLEGEQRASSIKSSGQLLNARAFRDTVVAYRNGAPVRLRDLGTVEDSVQQDKQISWSNGGVPSITLAVERQPGTNTVQVVDAIRKLLPALERQVPPSVKVDVFYDRSESIRESVADVKFTLVLTVFLVVLVIFIFLRNLPATVIPSLALPMSVISTFAVMAVLGYSLDNLSLMALTLAVGFVVDDAIVMLENIVRHQEMGKDPLRAAYDGSAEIGFTIVSMTISLAGLTGNERVMDAYCGIGTIGLIASRDAREVISVELNPDAVRDAVTNAKRNQIKNVSFYQNDAGTFMVSMAEKGEKADVVFMDPPRAGSDEAFLSSVVTLSPKKVVYVSCNPETLARDLRYLTKHGYKAEEAWGYDICLLYTSPSPRDA